MAAPKRTQARKYVYVSKPASGRIKAAYGITNKPWPRSNSHYDLGQPAHCLAKRLGVRLSSAAFRWLRKPESGRGQPHSKTLRDVARLSQRVCRIFTTPAPRSIIYLARDSGVYTVNRPLQVLLIEDSEDDAALLEIELQRAGYALACSRVETHEALRAALERQGWDLVISDYRLPNFNGLAALALVNEKGLDLPFIIVSGYISDETAVAAMKAGAHDYVMKDNLARLGQAVERELREAEVRRQRRRAEEDLRRAYEELETRVQERTADLSTANARLQTAIAERRRLEYELLEITEKERRRIGLDLHDDLGQQLSGLALMTKGLELKLAKRRAPETADAARIHKLVQQALSHARDLAHDLATLDLKGGDLPAAFDGLARHAADLFKISCQFEAKGTLPPLESNIASQLYKIAQEAVTNAIKHAKARRVGISLANGSGAVILTVHNDGLPFPSLQGSSTGMGLRIMNYRANLIGAVARDQWRRSPRHGGHLHRAAGPGQVTHPLRGGLKSGTGQPHSRTLRVFPRVGARASVLECGCPLPL